MSLPGELIKLVRCTLYCQYTNHVKPVVASHRLCTESDSFGDEYIYCCEECASEIEKKRAVKKEEEIGCCDFCKTSNVAVKSFRDPEEGTHGPVYTVCYQCRKKTIDAFCDDSNY